MIIDLDRLEEVKFQLSELGRVVSETSKDNKENFETINSSMIKLKEVLTSTVTKDNLDSLSKLVNPTFEQFNKFTLIMDSFISKFGVIDNYSDPIKKSSEIFSKFSKGLSDVYERKSLQSMITYVNPPKAIDEQGKKARKETKDKSSAPKIIIDEIKSIRNTISGALHKLHIPTPGNILAGGIVMMAMGAEREQESKTMAATARNTMINAFDSGVKGLIGKASESMKNFAYDMEHYAKIPKEEIYSIEQAFINAGHGIKETMDTVIAPSMGEVGESLVSLTLAVDKMFGLASGTTADRLNNFARDFGMSMSEAKDKVLEMIFFGRESGIGAEYFVSNIEKATDSISSLGLKIGNISEMLYTLQKRFEDINVPKHLAAKEVAKGLGEVAQGLTGISNDWKLFLGEQMGYGKGLEAKQRYEDAIARFTSASPEQFSDFINKHVEIIKSRVPNPAELRQVLMNIFGISGSRLALEWNKAVESGNVKTKEGLKDSMKRFQDELGGTFKRERDKVSDFYKSYNKWMEGISDIGRWLLGKVSRVLGFMVSYFRNSIELIANLFKGEKGERANKKLLAEIDKTVNVNKAEDEAWLDTGMKKLKEAGMSMMDSAFKDSIDMLNNAWNVDYKTGKMPEEGAGQSTPLTPSSIFGPTSVVMVPIPIKEAGVYNVPIPEERQPQTALEAFAQSSQEKWVGGGLQIVSKGVDDSGNIVVYLSGNCPKCGLQFGLYEGSSDISVPNLSKKSNVGSNKNKISVMKAKTGESMNVDFSDPSSMSRLSSFSKSGKSEENVKTLDPRLADVLSKISEQYPGKKIKVFRGSAPVKDEGGKENPHTRGQAMDIAVQGVANKDLFRFLRSGKVGQPIGKGFYPNLPFVHVDVRNRPAEWVDVSRSREGSKYLSPSEKSKYIRENIGETVEESYLNNEDKPYIGRGND